MRSPPPEPLLNSINTNLSSTNLSLAWLCHRELKFTAQSSSPLKRTEQPTSKSESPLKWAFALAGNSFPDCFASACSSCRTQVNTHIYSLNSPNRVPSKSAQQALDNITGFSRQNFLKVSRKCSYLLRVSFSPREKGVSKLKEAIVTGPKGH